MISGVPYCACRSPYTGAYCQNGPSSTSTNTNPTTYVFYIVVCFRYRLYNELEKLFNSFSILFTFFIELLLIILSNGFNLLNLI